MGLSKPTSKSNTARGCLFLFGLLWTLFSSIFVVVPWVVGGGIASEAPWPAALFAGGFSLFGLVFVGIGLVMMGIGLQPLIMRMKVAPPEVSLAPEAASPGESLTFTYKQTFKRPVQVNRISFRFLFRETATYQRGKHTDTVTHEDLIDSTDHPGRRYEGGDSFYDQRTLRIPEDGMHTFIAARNKLQWFVTMRVEIAGWPDSRDEYEVRVTPE